MKVNIKKWGNSLAVRIPSHVAKELEIKEGDALDLKIDSGKIFITKANRRRSFDELVAKITPENLHDFDSNW